MSAKPEGSTNHTQFGKGDRVIISAADSPWHGFPAEVLGENEVTRGTSMAVYRVRINGWYDTWVSATFLAAEVQQ